jgi:hypothetical protein
MNVSPHLPLLTALFVLAPERDADGDEAHQEDLDGHASSPSIRYANALNGRKCSVAALRCEEVFFVCPRKFLNAGATRPMRWATGAVRYSPGVTRTI